eukprot:gene1318-8782_t
MKGLQEGCEETVADFVGDECGCLRVARCARRTGSINASRTATLMSAQ